jgi:hypothetical protein
LNMLVTHPSVIVSGEVQRLQPNMKLRDLLAVGSIYAEIVVKHTDLIL